MGLLVARPHPILADHGLRYQPIYSTDLISTRVRSYAATDGLDRQPEPRGDPVGNFPRPAAQAAGSPYRASQPGNCIRGGRLDQRQRCQAS